MGVSPRFSLSTKFVLLALLNVAVLAAVFLVFVRWQASQEFESFLMTTARERIGTVSRNLALELQQTDRSEWSKLLHGYSAAHGVTFVLVSSDGTTIAGPELELPRIVEERLVRPPQRTFGWMTTRRDGREVRSPPLWPPPAHSDAEARQRHLRFMPYFIPSPPFLVVAESPVPYWVGVRMLLPPESDREPIRATLLIVSSSFFSNPFFFQLKPWLWIGAAAILVSFLCWLPLLHGLTKSTAQMMRATSEIAEGNFDVHVNDTRGDELGHLGGAINRMAGRLATFTRGQKRFLGDVAHELRSPLARMQLALSILERKAGPDGQAYVRDLLEDVETMTRLTDELLAFAKAELSAGSIELGPVNVLEGVQRAVRAEAREDVTVEVNVPAGLHVIAEPELLFRSVSNLVRNAVRYAGADGPIRITAERRNGQVRIAVADSGPGVPEDALEKIFTPFFRLDASRNRKTGGTGLGLAIVRSAVEACHGSLECRNPKPSGLEVAMTFPEARNGSPS